METDIVRNQQMTDIRSLSKQMLQLARDKSWEDLASLEPQRRDLIIRFFATPASEPEAAQIATTIRDVLEMDKEIIERGQQGREVIRQQFRQISNRQSAVRAYREAEQ